MLEQRDEYVLGPDEAVPGRRCGSFVTPGHLDEFCRLKDQATDPAGVARLVQEIL